MSWGCWQLRSWHLLPRESAEWWPSSCTARRHRSGTWQHCFASDDLGIITVAPVAIGLARALRETPPRSELIEGVAALVALAATIVFVILLPFEPWQAVRPAVLLFPVLLWLAARCRPVFAAAGAIIVSLTIVCTTTFGIGQLVNPTFPLGIGDPTVPIDTRILAAQMVIAACILSTNILAALLAERRAIAGSAHGRGGDRLRVRC
jgi:hypothetical protein